ncbi:MAG: PLP-dependent transferase [Myxococcales bacterium]|jgi:cystathionine gamma-lyase|nr:PLP-dependent transferase [Myxococcales bacterium]
MSKTHSRQQLETLAIHAGQPAEPVTGAITPPVFMTSTYVQDGPGGHKGYEYSRTHNPTRQALEANIAALEGGQFGVAFASGCAATTTILHTLSAGDHVVAGDDLYGGTYRIFERVMKQLGISVSYVDPMRPAAFGEAMRPNTKLVWVETPTNPLLKLCDIAEVAKLCHAAKLPLFVDNTFMSPVLQRPLELGATAVVHSTTKYINGHADVVGGVVVTSDVALHERLRFLQNAIGAVPGPLDCFLVMRGAKTLPLRMGRHCENGQAMAEWLQAQVGHGLIERVIYPGLPSHPQYELARRQMHGPGGMISFVVADGRLPALERAVKILRQVKLIACAESLGGVESLIEHPASMTHASIPVDKRAELGISDGLIRLSVGIEHIDDLREDLAQAFASAE